MTDTLPTTSVVDLSNPNRPNGLVPFVLYGHTYHFAAAAPLANLAAMAKLQTQVGANFEHLDVLWELWALVMPKESVERMKARASDLLDPIDQHDMISIQNFMLETWGKGRTPPSGSSWNGSSGATTGTSSTDGPPPAVSTPEPSNPTGS